MVNEFQATKAAVPARATSAAVGPRLSGGVAAYVTPERRQLRELMTCPGV